MKFTPYVWLQLLSFSLFAGEPEIVYELSPGSHLIADVRNSEMNQNASTTLVSKEKVHYKTFAEFLYWKRSSGLTFVTDGTGWQIHPPGPLNEDINITARGNNYHPEFSYAPGFNIGFGLDLPRDNWDLQLSYLWVHNEASHHYLNNPTKGWAPPFFFFGEAVMNTNSGREKADETLNFLQLELGRKFSISQNLFLRPHVDLDFLYIPGSLTVNYDITDTNSVRQQIAYDCNNHSIGGGAGIGVDTQWEFVKEWAFLGNVTINTVWTHFKAKQSQNVKNLTTNVSIQNVLTDLSTNKVLYLANLFLGVEWGKKFHRDKCYVSTYAGWDFLSGLFHFFPGNMAQTFSEPYDYQGLRAGLGFEF